MPFDFHNDRRVYFEQQRVNAEQYIHPFIEKFLPLNQELKVLEIGCAEGGVLCSFLEKGAYGVGIELSEMRIKLAQDFLTERVPAGRFSLINENIYDVKPETHQNLRFDLIVLKDVIEHIPNQQRLLTELHRFLTPAGKIFFGFPPWQMPFGGHQQMCRSSILHVTPWIHLLPTFVYKFILKAFKEPESVIKEMLELKETGLSVEQFEGICSKSGYKIISRQLYFINPIYQYKFNLKPRKQNGFLSRLPYIRNFVTTCGYYLIESKDTVD